MSNDYQTTGGWWCHRCQAYFPYGVDHSHEFDAEPELRIFTDPAPTVTENLLPTLEEIRDLLQEVLGELKAWRRKECIE